MSNGNYDDHPDHESLVSWQIASGRPRTGSGRGRGPSGPGGGRPGRRW